MEATSAEAEAYASLTREEEIHCHKARIFNLLKNRPVVRAWKDAICDGALYLGNGPFGRSYADRYFETSIEDISYVTFSIVTAFDEIVCDSEGQEIKRSQCHVSPAQREASEFLIVTYSNDHNLVALLPHRIYWLNKGLESSTGLEYSVPDLIPASITAEYSFSITLLLANIDEVKRITKFPMHPTTTTSQIGLDGLIPTAGIPHAIMPRASRTQMVESDESDSSVHGDEDKEEEALRIMHKQIPKWVPVMKIDFLDYQPLLRDFKFVISSCSKFPDGLEAVISHYVGLSTPSKNSGNSSYLRYADYHFSHGVMDPDVAMFVPRRLVSESYFEESHGSKPVPMELNDCGRPIDKKNFMFDMDSAGRWAKEVWRIIREYPPDDNPTPAENKRAIWKKAFPWPESKSQVPLPVGWKVFQGGRMQGDKPEGFSKHDSGTGDDGAVKPSDASLLLDHYVERALLDQNLAGEDDT